MGICWKDCTILILWSTCDINTQGKGSYGTKLIVQIFACEMGKRFSLFLAITQFC